MSRTYARSSDGAIPSSATAVFPARRTSPLQYTPGFLYILALFIAGRFIFADVPSGFSIGTENPIPEKMDHCEIAVRVPVMNEVQLLFPSEPRKPLKSRSLYVVFLVEKDVRVERRRTSNYLNHEEIEWQ